ncbi:MAG: hypothetical protein HC813_00090 [Planctomycetes bacterium]|nr:hypothetical protein [Planctomycetota bacterium]
MKSGTSALFVLAGLLVLLAFAFLRLVPLDRAALTGAAIGATLGLLNIVLGVYATRSALRKGPAAALRTMLGGFFLRLLLLVGLVLWFQSEASVNEVAFALSFFAFFFVFLAVEVRMIQKPMNGSGSPA